MPHTLEVIRRLCAGIAFMVFIGFGPAFSQNTPTLPDTAYAPTAQDSPVVGGVEKTDVHIESTDLLHFAKFGRDSVRIRKLIGNVKLRQDSTFIYCDSAMQFIDTTLIIAKGHVKITMEGNRIIWADNLVYRGDVKILVLEGNVRLKDSSITLFTDKMIYYRNESYGEYTTGGRLVSKENVLTSRKGYYYPDNKMAYFRDDVVLTNPEFTLKTDTLGYNTDTRIAFFLAPTWVEDSLNSMYTEDGYYDTENKFAYLHTNARIGDKTYTLFADTIQYDQGIDLGRAIGHVVAEQKDSSMTVYGKYAEFKSKTESTYITDSTYAVQIAGADTLYLFADTMNTYTDTLTDKRFFFAHANTRIYKNDLQGICDSLAYWIDDSLMILYKDPVIWSEKTQLTGDTIGVLMAKGGIDSLYIPSNPMISTQEDTVGYDQIKGNELSAKFENKQLVRMYVDGSSESIYYTKDDKEKYIGMNKAKCTNMFVQFRDNKPSSILFDIEPEGTFYPLHLITEDVKKLDGFSWRESERPQHPDWAAERIRLRYGPVDSLARGLDSINRALDAVENALRLLIDDAFQQVNEAEDSLEALEDSLAFARNDTLDLPLAANDSMQVDSLPDPKSLKGNAKASLQNPYDYTGAGNRHIAEASPKLSFKEKLLMPFAEPEVRASAKLDRDIRKISAKADREEKGRYASIERAQERKIDKIDSRKFAFVNPRIKGYWEPSPPAFDTY